MVRLVRLLAIHVCVVYEITHTQKEVNNNNRAYVRRECVCVYTLSLSQTRSPQNNNNTAR